MRLSRTDLVPVLVIVAGGALGASFSFGLFGSRSDDVPATEWSSEITGFPVPTETVGGTQRRAVGNAVAVVDAAAITAQVPITSMQQMLAARTPGLNFTSTSGAVFLDLGPFVVQLGYTGFDLASPLLHRLPHLHDPIALVLVVFGEAMACADRLHPVFIDRLKLGLVLI